MADADAQQQPKSKLEEQARAKGDISYSYWANPSQPANTDIQPVKLSEGAAAAGQQQQAPEAGTSQHVASTWNAAGTFEERDVSDRAKQRLEEMVVGTSSGSVTITSCRSIRGHANIWFIRGKKRAGYDFELECAWQHTASAGSGSGGGDAVQGTLKVPSASPDDLDDLELEVSLDSASGDAAADSQALQAARALKQPLQELLARLLAELREL